MNLVSGTIGGSWAGASHATARTVAVPVEGATSARRHWHLATLVNSAQSADQADLHVVTLEARQRPGCIGRDGFDVGFGACETYAPDCPAGRNRFTDHRGCVNRDTREVTFRMFCRDDGAKFACSECDFCVDTPTLALTAVAAYAKTFQRTAIEATIGEVDVVERVRSMRATRVATAPDRCCLGAASVDYLFTSSMPAPPTPTPPTPPRQPPSPPQSPGLTLTFPSSHVKVHEVYCTRCIADARDVAITGGCIGSSDLNPCLPATASVVTMHQSGTVMRPGPDWVMWYLGAVRDGRLYLISIEVRRDGRGSAILMKQTAYYEAFLSEAVSSGLSASDINTDNIDVNALMSQPGFRVKCPRRTTGVAGSYNDPGAGAAVSALATLSTQALSQPFAHKRTDGGGYALTYSRTDSPFALSPSATSPGGCVQRGRLFKRAKATASAPALPKTSGPALFTTASTLASNATSDRQPIPRTAPPATSPLATPVAAVSWRPAHLPHTYESVPLHARGHSAGVGPGARVRSVRVHRELAVLPWPLTAH
jgi:hypothetical protein